MRYYKNIELSKRFGIGGNTISRWIENANEGKNSLLIKETKQLTNDKIVYRIISNGHNENELIRLFQNGRSRNQLKNTKPIDLYTKDLKIFTTKEITNLITALEEKHIPFKLSYKNNGATLWDEFIKEGKRTGDYTTTKRTEELLKLFIHHLEIINPNNKKINFFDIGCGNFMPVEKFVRYLNDKKMLNKYIAIDISKEMLEIAKSNAEKILTSDQVKCFVGDFEKENFSEYSNLYRDEDTINVITILGSTIGNSNDQRVILTNLRDSLIKDDILLVSNKMDSQIEKSKFNHILDKNDQLLWIPTLLGIDTGEIQFNYYYDSNKDARIIAMKLDKDYDLTFHFENSTAKRKLYLNASDQIILWHHKMSKLEEIPNQFVRAGLDMIAHYTSEEDKIGLFICRKRAYSDRI